MSAMTETSLDLPLGSGAEGLMATQWDVDAEWILEIDEPMLSELEIGEFETVPADWV